MRHGIRHGQLDIVHGVCARCCIAAPSNVRLEDNPSDQKGQDVFRTTYQPLPPRTERATIARDSRFCTDFPTCWGMETRPLGDLSEGIYGKNPSVLETSG
jgi:hypothetical protein